MRPRGWLFYAFLSTLVCSHGSLRAMQREETLSPLSLPSAGQSPLPNVRGPPRNPPSSGPPGSQLGHGTPTRQRQISLSVPLAVVASPDGVADAAPARTLSRSIP
jgi:hypothetical protein